MEAGSLAFWSEKIDAIPDSLSPRRSRCHAASPRGADGDCGVRLPEEPFSVSDRPSTSGPRFRVTVMGLDRRQRSSHPRRYSTTRPDTTLGVGSSSGCSLALRRRLTDLALSCEPQCLRSSTEAATFDARRYQDRLERAVPRQLQRRVERCANTDGYQSLGSRPSLNRE